MKFIISSAGGCTIDTLQQLTSLKLTEETLDYKTTRSVLKENQITVEVDSLEELLQLNVDLDNDIIISSPGVLGTGLPSLLIYDDYLE